MPFTSMTTSYNIIPPASFSENSPLESEGKTKFLLRWKFYNSQFDILMNFSKAN